MAKVIAVLQYWVGNTALRAQALYVCVTFKVEGTKPRTISM